MIDDFPDALLTSVQNIATAVVSSNDVPDSYGSSVSCCDDCSLPDKLFTNHSISGYHHNDLSQTLRSRVVSCDDCEFPDIVYSNHILDEFHEEDLEYSDTLNIYQTNNDFSESKSFSNLLSNFPDHHFKYEVNNRAILNKGLGGSKGRFSPGDLAQVPAPSSSGFEKSINEFEDDVLYQIGAFSGRAVGWLPEVGNATGFLMGGPFLIASSHSGKKNSSPDLKYFPYFPKGDTTVVFGRYGRMSNKPYYKGIEDARNRLIDLGFPIRSIRKLFANANSRVQHSSLFSFNATFLSDEVVRKRDRSVNNRDINYFKFFPKLFESRPFPEDLTLPVPDRPDLIPVYPSYIFGHMPIEDMEGKVYVGDSVYKVAYKDSTGNISLYPFGNISKTNENPEINPNTQYYESSNFLVSGLSGSFGNSGAPILYLGNNRAFGVHQGRVGNNLQYVYGPYIPKDSSKNFPVPRKSVNFDSRITKFNNSQTVTAFSGNNSKNIPLRTLSCQRGYAAAGVIGSGISSNTTSSRRSIKNDRLGNFGLVCLPFTSPENYAFDLAKVIAGGSIDVGFTRKNKINNNLVENVPFNTYLNNYLTSGGFFTKSTIVDILFISVHIPTRGYLQDFAMCPPGFYLNNLVISEAPFDGINRIERIVLLGCKPFRKGKQNIYHRLPRNSIGASARFAANNTIKNLSCPDGFVVDGMNIRVDQSTDGFQLRCRKVD